jgi:tetratricopeptide (TPR) repeat protein
MGKTIQHCIGALVLCSLPCLALAQAKWDPAAAIEQTMAAAQTSLREGEPQTAESRYRSALLEGWMLVGTLERLEGRLPAARDAFARASASAVDDRPSQLALSLVHLQVGEPDAAVTILTRLAATNPKDAESRRVLAQALVASGQPARAVAELEAARSAAPGDLELAFALAGEYLRLQKPELAAALFAQIVKERPLPQTHVLIGRMYYNFGAYGRARAELQAAVKLDPRVRRARYYLGLAVVAEKGMTGLDEAIPEFQSELKLAPRDPLANLQLGIALFDTQRPAEALPALEIAARVESPTARTLYYLGRAQLAVGSAAEAVASLKRALALAREQGATTPALRAIHLQLAEALRKAGQSEEAATHFAESQRFSEKNTEAERAEMARYLAAEVETEAAPSPLLPVIEDSPLASLSPPQRLELKRRATAELARAYLNLGVLQAQGERFARAAEWLEKAAGIDPEFPNVQPSLGIAYFNAGQFDKATTPLARAVAAEPGDPGLKRMLALAWLNVHAYDKAADLLRGDPERATDPSLEFAYGLALVKSDRAVEGESVFSSLLARHGDSAELSVLLGQANAQMGDFEAAIEALERALRLKPGVAEANASLGVIYLKQGRLPEAEKALREELAGHPADLQSQQNLAVVLEQTQRPEEAIPLLQGLLRSKPDHADARYLLGKILLAHGPAAEAAEHLEAAVRLAPEDANIHYQLGQAYQKLGRTEQAQQEFELVQQIKARR